MTWLASDVGMAIERRGEASAGLTTRAGLQVAKKAAKKGLKKSAKKTAEKHAAKHAAKHPAKHASKKGAKHAGRDWASEEQHRLVQEHRDEELDEEDLQIAHSFHHLHRAAAIISLLEHDSGGDLRMLLERGMELYRTATSAKKRKGTVRCAFGLLRAAEHLGMAGLYAARSDYRVEVPPPSPSGVAKQLRELGPRLDELKPPERENARRLCNMARELLRRAESVGHDPHLEYELTMAAEGICDALEQGL